MQPESQATGCTSSFINVVDVKYFLQQFYDERADKFSMDQTKTVIGWREWLALPSLAIPAIKAKIDTGARTSALHAFFTERFSREGQRMIRFGIHPLQNNSKLELICEAPIVDERIVTDSGGHSELRYVIRVDISFKGITWPAEVTLTNRDNMKFRMLLGRTALAGQFLVDSEASFCGGRELGRIYKKRIV